MKKYYQVVHILDEMSFNKAAVHGGKTIIKRMPLGLKLFSAAPIPVVPNTAIGLGAQFATDKRSRDIGRVVARKGFRNIRSAGQKIKGLFTKSQ